MCVTGHVLVCGPTWLKDVKAAMLQSVEPREVQARRRAWESFLAWAHVNANLHPQATEEELDQVLSDYAEVLFANGRSLNQLKQVLLHLRGIRRHWELPSAREKYSIWAGSQPFHATVPMPPRVFAAVFSVCVLWQWEDAVGRRGARLPTAMDRCPPGR